MAEVFRMPTLGQTMEEGTIVRWAKAEGDTVAQGEILLEVMSDKATIEVESPLSGVVRRHLAAQDDSVPVNTPIAIIGTADEPIDDLIETPGTPPAAPAAQAAPAPAEQAAEPAPARSDAPAGRIDASPRARRLADESGVSITELAGKGTGPGGRIIERDIEAHLAQAAAKPAGPKTTPLAARIARDLGVDLGDLAMGLPGSRVTADDVRRVAETGAAPAQAAPPRPQAPAGEPTVASTIPYRGMRKMIADTVARSRHTAPHVCLNMEVDMTAAQAFYAKMRPVLLESNQTKVTYTDILVKAVARALPDHPLCNAALIGEEIRLYQEPNVGVAVATENGLIVPVIKGADRKTLAEVSIELKALAERCRTGKQTQDDLAGGTFTITNLGAFGIDSFDPILVPPQSCILGVTRIADKPVALGGQVVVRPMMNLCLSFDHRVLDGVPGARFLMRLKQLLEDPVLIFV